MTEFTNKNTRIHGNAAPEFDTVRLLFEERVRTFAERDVQLCVYHRGAKVVDLWASASDDGTSMANTLVNVFSSSKSLETIAIARLSGEGLLRYDAYIAEYRPELDAHAKSKLTVADLMRQETASLLAQLTLCR